jgi:hypothetical protein
MVALDIVILQSIDVAGEHEQLTVSMRKTDLFDSHIGKFVHEAEIGGVARS